MDNELVKPIIKGVLYDRTGEITYFGHCLHKEHKNFQINIGVDNWFFCPICKIKWHQGRGNFSEIDEDKMTQEELMDRCFSNQKMLEDFEDVTNYEDYFI